MKTRKTVGLALGAGHFRGFAHVGVIKTLEKNLIPIDYLSGSSIGAWVAAHYAIFKDIKKLERILISNPTINLPIFFDVSLTGGFISGKKFITRLEKNLHHHDFSSLKIPLRIVATDLIKGRPFVFSEGKVSKAVRASTSVPLIFKPVPYKNKLLVDGGLSNPVPTNLLRKMGADLVVGVNLYNKNEFVTRKFTMPKILTRSTRIIAHNLAKADLKNADAIIEPDTSRFVNDSGFRKYFTKKVIGELIEIGEKSAEKIIPRIKKLLAEQMA